MATPFCTLTDVSNTGLPASAFGTLTAGQKQACVDRANAYLGSRLAGRYPGINRGGAGFTWDESVTGAAVSIACKYMLDTRGRPANPTNADALIDANYKAAEEWIEGVQKQAIHPYITGGEVAGTTSQGPVITSASAAWTNSALTAPNRGI